MSGSAADSRLTASMLRLLLGTRNRQLAVSQGLLHDLTTGSAPSIIFGRDERGRHGNFHPASYRKICQNPAWAHRLTKVHTASRRAMPRADWRWRELDCANSSDALLMSIFCHPQVFRTGLVCAMLGVDRGSKPEFGCKPRVPLLGNKADRTEVDMKLGGLLVEAKLTEASFQNTTVEQLVRYRDFETVFDLRELPRRGISVRGYQLIRGALAAYAGNASFCVLCDARRVDLIDEWYAVLSAVCCPDFRWRLKILTWQELAAALPLTLQRHLEVKYDISPD